MASHDKINEEKKCYVQYPGWTRLEKPQKQACRWADDDPLNLL